MIAVLLLATVVGLWLRGREGRVRVTSDTGAPGSERAALLVAAGASPGAVTVLHFAAPWCRPCVAVRRVVAAVVTDQHTDAAPTHDVEVDLDTNPALARAMGVLSLPTTFVLDPDLGERFRVSGVPSADDLTEAVRSARDGR